MKNLITTLIILASLTPTTIANELQFSAGSDFKSTYVAPSGIMAYDNPVIQSWFGIYHEPSGLSFNVWHSGSADSHFFDKQNKWATEIDYTLTLTKSWWEAGVSYWDLAEQGDHSEDMIYSYLKFFGDLYKDESQKLTVYVKGANYTETGGSVNNGNAIFTGIDHSIRIVNKSLTINSGVGICRNWRIFQMENSIISYLSNTLSWKLADNITLNLPSANFYLPLEEGTQETEFVIGSGLVIKLNKK